MMSPAEQLMVGVYRPTARLPRELRSCRGKTDTILRQWQKEWPRTTFTKASREAESAAKKIRESSRCPICCSPERHVPAESVERPARHRRVETVSYGGLAKRIKNPKAARAVGGGLAVKKSGGTVRTPLSRDRERRRPRRLFQADWRLKRMLPEAGSEEVTAAVCRVTASIISPRPK